VIHTQHYFNTTESSTFCFRYTLRI